MNPLYRQCTKSMITALGSALLAACGGSSGDTNDSNQPQTLAANNGSFAQFPADTITRTGAVIFTTTDSPSLSALGFPSGLLSTYAEFTQYKQVLSEAYIASAFSSGDIDTCTITIDSSDGSENVSAETALEFDQLILNSTSISAGEVLSMSTPTGSWPDLISIEEFYGDDRYVSYDFQSDTSTLGELPQGSTITIPGDEFPAFTNISIPHVERLTDVALLNTTEDRVTGDTQINWKRPTNSAENTFARISLYNEVVSDNSTVELYIDLNCLVADDGQFSFPDNAQALLSEYHFTNDELLLTRAGVTSSVQGDAALYVGSSSTYFFR